MRKRLGALTLLAPALALTMYVAGTVIELEPGRRVPRQARARALSEPMREGRSQQHKGVAVGIVPHD